ncbi:hypothetical protein C8R44DRAFT_865846 [Mycena epipterygia]|nr:hypothetical protein C8R44DRAFT_865846 [Mycena epipterygia]
MSLIPLLGANLAVVVLESFLCGIYVILALFTLYLMVTRHRERRSKLLSPVTLGALALFVMVTSRIIFTHNSL